MEQTRIFTALKGVRGRPPVDLAALEQLLVRFSDLVVEQRWIKEIDINPLLASPERLLALDARVIVHGPEVLEVGAAAARDPALSDAPGHVLDGERRHGAAPAADPPGGRAVAGRLPRHALGANRRAPLLPRDEAHTRVAHERLTRICFVDYDREMVLVAERPVPRPTAAVKILGVGRLNKIRGTGDAEFALLISDRFQKRGPDSHDSRGGSGGLGTAMLSRLIGIGRAEGVRRIVGVMLQENMAMRRSARSWASASRMTRRMGLSMPN